MFYNNIIKLWIHNNMSVNSLLPSMPTLPGASGVATVEISAHPSPSSPARESGSPSTGGPAAAQATVRLVPNQGNRLNQHTFKWEGKTYKIFVLDAGGQQLSTTKAQWERIAKLLHDDQNRTQFLDRMHEQYNSFQAATVQSASWRFEDEEFAVNFDRSSTPRISGTLAGAAHQAFSGLRTTVLSAFPSGSTSSASSPSSTAAPHAPSARPTPASPLPTPPPRTVPSSSHTPVRVISGTRNQTDAHYERRGHRSCTANAGRALISMLTMPPTTPADLDDILDEGINAYQTLIPAYRQAVSSASEPGFATRPNPLLPFDFVADRDPQCSQFLECVSTGNHRTLSTPFIDTLVGGQEKNKISGILHRLQTACDLLAEGQSLGGIFIASQHTYAIKVTKERNGRFTYDLYDSHGGGTNNAASLKTFGSLDALAHYLAGKHRALNPNAAATSDGRREIQDQNFIGIHILRCRDSSAANPSGAALPTGSR